MCNDGLNITQVEPIDVSLQEIAERTPFQTSEGTRFIATKHSHVVLVDGTTGMIVKRLSPDGWGSRRGSRHRRRVLTPVR